MGVRLTLLFALLKFASSTAAAKPRREPCLRALKAGDNALEEDLEACVPAVSRFFGFVGAGYQISSNHSFSLVGQVASSPIRQALVTSRLQLAGATLRFDLEAGLRDSSDPAVFASNRRVDRYGYFTSQRLSSTEVLVTSYRSLVVRREQWVVNVGLHSWVARETAGYTDAEIGPWYNDHAPQVGLAYHMFTDEGDYKNRKLNFVKPAKG